MAMPSFQGLISPENHVPSDSVFGEILTSAKLDCVPVADFPRQLHCTIALEYLRFSMKSFWSELKRRNVVRVGVAYLAGTWLSLQVADTVLPNLDAPA